MRKHDDEAEDELKDASDDGDEGAADDDYEDDGDDDEDDDGDNDEHVFSENALIFRIFLFCRVTRVG